jgi:hypothetical protein
MSAREDTEAAPRASNRAGRALPVAALLLLVATAALSPLDTNDVWIHLVTGRLVLEEGEVPRVDRYSFVTAGRRYVAHEWLAATLYAAAERLGGEWAVVVAGQLLPALAAVAALCLALRASGAPAGLGLPLAVLALGVARSRLFARPELLALPILLLFLALLWRDREASRRGRRTRALWLLLPLETLWANLHGSFVLGPVLVLVFAAAEALEAGLRAGGERARRTRRAAVALGLLAAAALATRRPPAFGLAAAALLAAGSALFWAGAAAGLVRLPAAAPRQGLARLLGLAALLVAAALANPRGAELLLFPFEFTTGASAITRLVNEWQPLLSSAYAQGSLRLHAFLGFAAVGCAALALAARRACLGLLELGLLLAFGLLALCHERWIGTTALLTAPALASLLAAARAASRAPGAVERGAGLVLGLAALAAAARALLGVRPEPGDSLFAAALLALLACGALAVALAWRPRWPLRLGAVAAGGVALALALLAGARGLPERPGQPDWAWLQPDPARLGPSLEARPAIDFLAREGIEGRLFTEYAWAGYAIHETWPRITVFLDSRSEVHGEALLQEHRRARARTEAARETLALWDVDLALVRFRPWPRRRQPSPGMLEALRRDPAWELLFVDDRSVLYARHRPGRALPEPLGLDPLFEPGRRPPPPEAVLRGALRRAPRSAFLHYLLADRLLEEGRTAEALAVLEAGWRVDPGYAALPLRAGRVALRAGDGAAARRWLERALEAEPGAEAARRALARLDAGAAR